MARVTEYLVNRDDHSMDRVNSRELQADEVEVRVYLPKKGVNIGGNEGHSALRYRVQNQEYYVSLFPADGTVRSYCTGGPSRFNSLAEDVRQYIRDRVNAELQAQPSNFEGYYYRIRGTDINATRLHEKLSAHLASEIGARFLPIAQQPNEPHIPTINADANANANEGDKFFKYWANPCCCVPLGLHNCASLVSAFLPDANLTSDLNNSATARRLFFIVIWSFAMGYLFSESISINNPGKTKVDEVFGIIGAALGVIGFILYLSTYAYFPKSAKDLILPNTSPLLIKTNTATLVGTTVGTLALITFVIHATTSSGSDRVNTIVKDNLEFIILGAVSAGLFLLSVLWSWCQDRQNGCTNPYALKRMLHLAANEGPSVLEEAPPAPAAEAVPAVAEPADDDAELDRGLGLGAA